jgi:hypothetical protein
MKKNIKVEVPTSWESITLRKYLDLQKDLENYSDNEEAQTAAMFHHLCGLDPTWVTKLSIESYNTLRVKLLDLVHPKDVPLTKFVNIEGVEFGFEPNLSTMTYGAYSDISSFETIQIDKTWAKVMNILYRPITLKSGKLYNIESYEPNDDWERWLDVSMEVHFGTWFFFINLQKDLLNAILKYTKEMELPPNIKSILERSGKIIHQSTN